MVPCIFSMMPIKSWIDLWEILSRGKWRIESARGRRAYENLWDMKKTDFRKEPTNLAKSMFCNFHFMNLKISPCWIVLGRISLSSTIYCDLIWGLSGLTQPIYINNASWSYWISMFGAPTRVQLDRFLQPPSGSTFLQPGAPGGSRSDNKAALG